MKFIPTTGYIQAFIIFVIISSHLSVFIEPVLMFLFHQKCLGRFRFWLFMIVFWCGFCQLKTTASSILWKPHLSSTLTALSLDSWFVSFPVVEFSNVIFDARMMIKVSFDDLFEFLCRADPFIFVEVSWKNKSHFPSYFILWDSSNNYPNMKDQGYWYRSGNHSIWVLFHFCTIMVSIASNISESLFFK